MIRKLLFIYFLIFLILNMNADSLWNLDFPGYISGSASINIGDIVIVEIDSSFSLDFESSSKDSKSITLEFSGGEYGNLFSFLPTAKSGGDRSIKGKESYTLTAQLVGRVTQIDDTGKLFIQGIKSIQFEGKAEAVTISGWVDPQDLNQQRRISFSQIADVRLVFTSFLEPAAALISDADIQRVLIEVQAAEEGEEAVTQERIELSEAKRRELILRYLNRLIDIIFQ